jgi:lycopene beta-cyclase
MTAGGAPDADVVVVGDGPAGLALAAECHRLGMDVVAVGAAARWEATYATWVDDVPDHASSLASRSPIDVVGHERRRLEREYGVFDNEVLRASLDVAAHVVAEVVGVQHTDVDSTVVTAAGERVRTRLVVDARGSRPALVESPTSGARTRRTPPVVQSAYGLVLPERPAALDGDAAVLMDWRRSAAAVGADVGAAGDGPTFLYAVPLASGRWLVEETSLARRAPLPADELRRRLAARLGADLTDAAERIEHVLIPMASGVPRRGQRVVGFGAAAGYVHPATGYSVAASLRAGPRVASAIAESLGRTEDPRRLALDAWNAVWPADARRARALHSYGAGSVLRMSPDEIALFFDAFFSLPPQEWAEYLRVDTNAAAVSRVMRDVFSRLPWSVRRRLALGSASAFAGLMR